MAIDQLLKKPTSIKLLKDPLEFLSEDRARLRSVCTELDRLTLTPKIEQPAILALSDYLTKELPLLLADESEDLVPLILTKAEPEDELPQLAARLRGEHEKIVYLLEDVTSGFAALTGETKMPDVLREAMLDLANAARGHLILANAVLMPLARTRLTQSDLTALRLGMLKRRGLDDVFQE